MGLFDDIGAGGVRTGSGLFDDIKAQEQPGDAARGFKESFQQLPQLGYGILAGAGAAAENVVGEGGIATGIKKAGVKGYTEWGNKIAAGAKPSDSIDYSWEQAKQGDFGALVDWLQHGIGYVGGQGLQMLATAGIGSVGGKLVASTAAKQIAEGMVAKETARLVAENAGKAVAERVAADQIARAAVANVAGKFSTIGMNTALGATAVGMEGGEIFGGLTQQTEKDGRMLTGAELGKAFGATLAAGGLEFVGDKLGLDIVLGKSRFLKPTEYMKGVTGRASRGILAAGMQAPIEAGTEYGQTLIEEYGKGNDPTSDESFKQAREGAWLGALGGTVVGGFGGAIHGAKDRPPEEDKPPITAGIDKIVNAGSVDEAIAAAAQAVSGTPQAARPGPQDVRAAAIRTALDRSAMDALRAKYSDVTPILASLQQASNPNLRADLREPHLAALEATIKALRETPTSMPVGEVSEVIPTGDAVEVPDTIPVGEATELLPTPDVTETVDALPVGEATELEVEQVAPAPEMPYAPRQPRASSRPVVIDPAAMPESVRAYVDAQRRINTPMAHAFVQAFDAGRITPADVAAILTPRRQETADDRLAAAAAARAGAQAAPAGIILPPPSRARPGDSAATPEVSRETAPQQQTPTGILAQVAAPAGGVRGTEPAGSVAVLSGVEQAAGGQDSARAPGTAPGGGEVVPVGARRADAEQALTTAGKAVVEGGLSIVVDGSPYPVESLEQASDLAFKAAKEAERRAGGIAQFQGSPLIVNRDGAVVAHIGVGNKVIAGAPANPGRVLFDPIDAIRADIRAKNEARTVDADTAPSTQAVLTAPESASDKAARAKKQVEALRKKPPAPAPVAPSASWVIREKETGAVVMETFDRKKVDALNTAKYEAVPIAQYLAEVNHAVRDGKPTPPAVEAKPYAEMTPAEQADFDRRNGITPGRRAEVAAKLEPATERAPLYASRPVTNAQAIIDWAASQGFKSTLPASDMHVTVAYSRDAMDGASVPTDVPNLTVRGGKRTVEPLGDDGAVVLKFDSLAMQSRWQQYRNAGASWDYDSYTPHVTITYDGKGVDLAKVVPYAGPIELGTEKQESLNLDKADDYKEAGEVKTKPKADTPRVFKTRKAAEAERDSLGNEHKLQPIKGGFILRRKTDKEMAAEARNGRRLRAGASRKRSLLTVIAAGGGLNIKDRADTIGEGNRNVGGKMLFTREGRSIHEWAESLHEYGWMPVDESESVEWLMKAIADEYAGRTTHYQLSDTERLDAQLDAMRGEPPTESSPNPQEEDPFSWGALAVDPLAPFNVDDLTESGYAAATPEVQALTEQMLTEAQALGIDVDTIREDAASNTEATEDEYHAAVQAALAQAIAQAQADASRRDDQAARGGGEDRGETAGRQGAESGQGLTSPTPESLRGATEDVGENLIANRRNVSRGGIGWSDVADLADALKVREVVKAKVWPRPDYAAMIKAGTPPMVARAIKQVYDSIGSGPVGTTDEALKLYIDTLAKVRAAIDAWAADAELTQALAENAMRDYSAAAKASSLLTRIWPDLQGARMFIRGTAARDEALALGGNKAVNAMQFGREDLVKWDKEIAGGWPEAKEAWERQGITIYPAADAFVIQNAPQRSEGGAERWTLRTIKYAYIGEYQTRAEAEAARDALGHEWVVLSKAGRVVGGAASQDAAKEVARGIVKREKSGGGGSADSGFALGDAQRVGADRREAGQNISAQQLMDTFGFRGVNFGRIGYINAEQRQAYLNAAWDGLHDLAELTGLPPKALSLNGELGLAFGAQGRGGRAAAHFVPGFNEINLTRDAGAGTLAHEWGHALDHMFGALAGLARETNPFLSDHAALGDKMRRSEVNPDNPRQLRMVEQDRFAAGLRPEMLAAFKALHAAMNKRAVTPEMARLRQSSSRSAALERLNGWIAHMRKAVQTPQAQAEFDALAEKLRAGDLGDGYVRVGRMNPLRKTVGDMALLVRAKGDKAAGVDMPGNWKGLDSNASHVAYILAQREAEAEHIPQGATTSSAYANESAAADGAKKGKKYWSTEHEKFARAFETWVSDRLKERAQANTFLSTGGERADDTGERRMPYPRGDEREAMARAFDTLMGGLKTRETDKGVAVFEPEATYGVANETPGAQNAPYETDLFGNSLPEDTRKDRRQSRPDRAGVRGNVQSEPAVPADTQAPPGDYYAPTIVGVVTQRKLGAARITSAQEAAQATRYLYDSAVERLDGVVTDKDGKPLAVVGGFKGALSQTSVYPATLMGEAVRIPGAAHIWFSHNHPSGTAHLSRADEFLNSTLAEVFRGSGIEPEGMLAIGDGQFGYAAPNDIAMPPIDIPSESSSIAVPVIERQATRQSVKTPTLSSPADAKNAADIYYKAANNEPGILLLNAQHRVAAWVPLPPGMKGLLRGTGGLNAIYRAVSESNAGAAIIVHGGELDGPVMGNTSAQNIASALAKIDVRPIDIINARTGASAAELGKTIATGAVYSKGVGGSTSREALRSRMNAEFGADVIDALEGAGLLYVANAPPPSMKRNAAGVFDEGAIGLFAANTPDGSVAVAYHEALHATLRRTIGDEAFDALMARMPLLAAGNRKWFAEVADRIPADTPARLRNEELASYAVEQYQRARETMPAGVRKWVESFIAALKSGLAKALQAAGIGLKLSVKIMSDAGVLRILARDGLRAMARQQMAAEGSPAYSAKAPPFYSALARGIRSLPIKAGAADAWRSAITGLINKGAVKAAEFEWSGLAEWLGLQPGAVTKEQVLDYLDANGVRVEETVLGERTLAEWEAAERARLGTMSTDRLRDEAQNFDEGATREQLVDEAIEIARSYYEQNEDDRHKIDGGAKFGTYTLPGGTNYREVLLKLPPLPAKFPFPNPGNFRSAHWNEPNVLAHIRLNDRTDADGKRVLFVEEIQSDWAQQGKKGGFAGQMIPQTTTWQAVDTLDRFDTLAAAENWIRHNPPPHPGDNVEARLVVREVEEGGFDVIEEQRSTVAFAPSRSGLPRAPFVTKTDAWVALALKRVIHMAATEGYDRVAFITGKQSEDRYWGNDVVRPAVERWNEVTKPQSIRELAEDVLGREMAALMPLDHVDAGVLAVLKHDQVRRAVVQAVPVDVVNMLRAEKTTPDQLLREKNVVASRLAADSRRRAADGILAALRLTGASVRAELGRLTPGGPDVEVLPALRASQLNTREVAGLLDPVRLFHRGASGSPQGAAATGAGAEPLAGKEGGVGGREQRAAELAGLLNAHASILGRDALLRQGVEPPPGEGMRAFYDKIVPSVLKDVLKKLGGGQVGIVKVDGMVRSTNGNMEAGDFYDRQENPDFKMMEQPGFSITDRMREAAADGLPLFSRAYSTDTPAFRRWFGDSKVVDAQGRPLVVYHGTFDDFSKFSDRKLGANTDGNASSEAYAQTSRVGFWFNAKPMAGSSAGYTVDMPVYLSIQNPKREMSLDWLAQGLESTKGRTYRRQLIAKGYDGIVLEDEEFGGESWIAFHPEQIKSSIGNRGTFDPSSPDIRYSLAIGDALASGLNGVKEVALPAGYKVGDLFNGAGTISWWDKSVGTMYNLAQRRPAFRRVYDAVQTFLNDVSYYATEAADAAPSILPKLEGWNDIARSPLSAVDTKAVSRPVFEGTLTWARAEGGRAVRVADLEERARSMGTEDKAAELERRGFVSAKDIAAKRNDVASFDGLERFIAFIDEQYERHVLEPGVVWKDDELRSIFHLNDRQIGLYRETRAAIDKSLTALAVSDMLRFGGKDTQALRDEAMAARTPTDAAEMLRDHLRGAAALDPDRADALNDTGRKIIAKGRRARDLMWRGYAPLSRFGQHTVYVTRGGEQLYFGLFESSAQASMMARRMQAQFQGAKVEQGTMAQEAYKLFAGVSPETLELFGGMLGLESDSAGAGNEAFQAYLKLAKSNRSAMKRLIERKGIAGFSEDVGRVLAGFVYSNARQTAGNLHMGEMTEAAEAIDKRDGQLKDAAVKLTEYIRNPQEEAQAFRGLLFAQYLGGSVASAMVNATQPLAVTFPYLSQFGGIRAAARQMTAAVQDAFKRRTGDRALDEALKKAEEEGIVSPQETHQLMAQAMGRATLKSGDGTLAGDALAKGSNVLSKVGLAWGKVFGVAEQFNRRVTFIAAYRTAVARNMDDPAGFAAKAVAETQFTYNKGNRPSWARGAIGGTLFTFKQYSISYVELLARMYRSGPEGKKAALLALAVLFLMAGTDGLPGAEDLEDVIDGALQRMGYNFSTKRAKREFLTRALGEGGAQFVAKGLSGLPGAPIDVSGRMGLGNLVPGTGLLVKKADHTRDMTELLGPAGDFGRRAFEAAGNAVDREFIKAGEVLAPVALRNVIKAHDMATTGMYRDERGRKVIDATGYEAAMKSIGFQPNTVARVQESAGQVQQMVALNKLRESEIAEKWALGMFEHDPDKVREARAELAEWNADNQGSRISIKSTQVLQRVRQMRLSREERLARTAPAEIRRQVRDELSAAR